MRSRQVTLPSANFCRTRHTRAHGRPPGVNTYLSARGRRVYPLRQQWIEDFVLCCRLVPTTASLTRFLFVIPCICGILPQQDDLLQKCRHRHPLVLPLHPSPPSGWIRDLQYTETLVYTHPLEYVPCPAHNQRVDSTVKAGAFLPFAKAIVKFSFFKALLAFPVCHARRSVHI